MTKTFNGYGTRQVRVCDVSRNWFDDRDWYSEEISQSHYERLVAEKGDWVVPYADVAMMRSRFQSELERLRAALKRIATDHYSASVGDHVWAADCDACKRQDIARDALAGATAEPLERRYSAEDYERVISAGGNMWSTLERLRDMAMENHGKATTEKSDAPHEELLPCPFCGDRDIRVKNDNGAGCYAECGSCACELRWFCTLEEARAAWNRRVDGGYDGGWHAGYAAGREQALNPGKPAESTAVKSGDSHG